MAAQSTPSLVRGREREDLHTLIPFRNTVRRYIVQICVVLQNVTALCVIVSLWTLPYGVIFKYGWALWV